MSDKVYEVLGAFAGAKDSKGYRAAKSLCCRLFPNPVEQLAFVDAAREAGKRIGGAS